MERENTASAKKIHWFDGGYRVSLHYERVTLGKELTKCSKFNDSVLSDM